MSDDAGSSLKPKSDLSLESRVTLKSDIAVEALLVAALAVYFILAESQAVGSDMLFTAVGAVLMALATFWTLNTVGDVIEVVAARRSSSKG
ncbi:hypothetical protein RE428_02030 [Marinobacter nanhaiticus D15-8W]|uniref:hypothetical protein n=1 Tax=Marinobacter nanhaiticus TaxID=1305740 RepID=UPI0003A676B9|nr:hypothetical protein [Marinobacter nanhaiticus]BES69185.1 hypothetical protein RE428_02030 [Marinobacter nanhaiticus D15-8W]